MTTGSEGTLTRQCVTKSESSLEQDSDQHERIGEALRAVTALRSLPDLRPGCLARIIMAEENLKRLYDLAPRFPAHPAYTENPRCERGCYVE